MSLSIQPIHGTDLMLVLIQVPIVAKLSSLFVLDWLHFCPDEALSWGKLAQHSNSVKITADASLVFPLVVAETFAQNKRFS